MILPILAGALVLAAAQAPAQPRAEPGAALERFFVGRTEGVGVVHVMLSGRHAVRDRGRGRIARDGALILDQIVEEEGKPARTRVWRLVRAGGNRLTGSISDARGPVAGTIAGNILHLRYRLADGPSVEQWITLHPNGRTAANRMVFRRFGIRVATMEAVIRRVE